MIATQNEVKVLFDEFIHYFSSELEKYNVVLKCYKGTYDDIDSFIRDYFNVDKFVFLSESTIKATWNYLIENKKIYYYYTENNKYVVFMLEELNK